ncbi:MAG: endonuclease/exonuclease/phosphatase family protein [Pirellulaceae bacterium]
MLARCVTLTAMMLLCLGVRSQETIQPQNKRLTIVQLNLWQEGTKVQSGFQKIIDIIIESKADVVTMSEVRNYQQRDLHQRMVQALSDRGHQFYGQYAGGDAGLLSRFPITKSELVADFTDADAGCIVASHLKISPQQSIVVCSAHLDYRNYAVYLPRGYDGNSFKPIDPDGDGVPNPITDLKTIHAMDMASKRDESIAAFLTYATQHCDRPVILAGDFNECSHLDWTAENRDHLSHNGVVISWQNSHALADAGFIDAYRQLHPDPVTHVGATWPSEAFGRESTSWAPQADERDRIDFVYFKGPGITATSANIVGSKKYFVRDRLTQTDTQDSFLLKDIQWPSDHKGVQVDFWIQSLQNVSKPSGM